MMGLATLSIALCLILFSLAWNDVPRAFGQTNSPASATVLLEGKPELHNKLTVTISDLQDADGVPDDPDFTYQWYWDVRSVSEPVSNNMDVTYRIIGKQVWVRVQFLDSAGNLETLDSPPTPPIPSGAEIVGPRGIFYHGETIHADTTNVNYPDLASPPNYRYQWIYWNYPDKSKDADIAGATGLTYELGTEDLGKIIQVELTYDSTEGGTRTKLSNFTTFEIRYRTELDASINLRATSPPNGGSLTLKWNQATARGIPAAGYSYRFTPVVVGNFTSQYAQDWGEAPGGASARSITLSEQLINGVEYQFEVRPHFADYRRDAYVPVATTGTFRHRTRSC